MNGPADLRVTAPRGRIPRPLTCAAGLADRSRGRDLLAPPSPLSPRRRARSVPAHPSGEPTRRGHSPETRKRVRFADTLGLELITVCRYSQSHDSQDQDSESESDSPDLVMHVIPNSSHAERKTPSWAESAVLQFQAPVTRPDFDLLVRSQGVCLESVCPQPVCLSGTVRVQNMSFHKDVVVRYTNDHWSSYSEVSASYLPPDITHFSLSTDRFQFRLPLPPAPPGPPGPGGAPPRLEFAVCYRVGGQEYWDSNGGANYALCWRPPSLGPAPQDSAWIHFI
ncbi:protein phosphatase 1 regulatory subunit 3E-like [Lepisosteus oculatus]|uniref:protein phosphatase 1 regulatory subunit 3E-like n=1 Tax=Lepisosteus oculatus TaxID=7918 RepID=UPI0037239663